ELRAGSPEESASIVRGILEGRDGPATRVVLANAAAALLAAERVTTPREGVALAAETVAEGKARGVLERLVACSQPEKRGRGGKNEMARKIILRADPGIDGAFATALAFADPEIDVLGLAATAGNVSAEVATRNVHILVESFDPPRWPRLGAAL